MVDGMYRETWAEINLDAIKYNITQIKEKLPQDSNIIAVVKANAYGHGIVPVAKKALESGANALAVAILEEAIILRNSSITVPILVLGWVPAKYVPIAAKYQITLTVFRKDWLEEVKQLSLQRPVSVHIKLDTGMGRIGLRSDEELISILQEIDNNNDINLTGIFTHFATADEKDLEYFERQIKRLEELLDVFYKHWRSPVTVHIGNSAASVRFPEKMHNSIRFGISMYGLYPSKIVKEENNITLKPAFSLHSKLINVKKIAKGESVSYGRTYIASEDEWIGTIPIGYGDGWTRKLQGMSVLVNNRKMPIVGRICMDQMMIRLDKAYEIGTTVTLIGKQGNELIEIDDIADYLETINYEIPCMINERVPRFYVENGNRLPYEHKN
ncbi:alanine racemase [Ornithinibacillus halotolerans]|uniref:Alanine racemase n=1 Tax=Ornithinibacillus halotolerans TaxID=1274357 RepID=A0A916WEB3_9BACI|nr:alanine racemase [Ornithinibacillus halotolerans]GGA92685.1 alanine racemase 1 [Ornithinibacillus halotolerans]